MRSMIVGLVLGFVLVGCGGSSGSAGPADSPDGPSLTDFIPGAVEFDEANAEQNYLQQEREAQDRIAACMADEGFEYIPYVQNQDQGGFAMPDTQEGFVAEYGFGIATMMLQDQQFDEEAMEAEMAKDPNNAIVNAMTDAEADAYYTALYGEQPEYEEYEEFGESSEGSTGVTVAPGNAVEPSGCQNEAYQEVFDQGAMMEFYEQFGPMMEDLYSGFDSDPRIATLDGEWSPCMAEQGYEFTTEADAQDFIMRRLEEVGAITNLEISDGSRSYDGEGIEPGSSMEGAVKEIAAEEMVIAKASLACSADREEVYQEVYRDAEQRFIDQHLAELEQFKKDHS